MDEFISLFSAQIKLHKGGVPTILCNVLSTIHKIKDDYLKKGKFELFTCITSLANINRFGKISSRTIIWHKLPNFSSELYLWKAWKKKPFRLLQANKIPIEVSEADIKRIANLCGDFPRGAWIFLRLLQKTGKMFSMSSLVEACIDNLENRYGAFYEDVPGEVILHLLGIKIWNMRVKKHLALTECIDKVEVHSYTKNYLTLNGLLFSNLRKPDLLSIDSSGISPIMLVVMLKTK